MEGHGWLCKAKYDMLKITKNRHFIRALRLALGLLVIWQGIMVHDWALITIGTLFALLSLMNAGCCRVHPQKQKRAGDLLDNKDIIYEEVKGKL